ncbi:MAG: BTAD domain-containing putative transcriptional regulator [Caldilineaceae bacterium]
MPALPVLRCFGQIQLECDGQSISLPTRKTAALLVYLVLHPETHPRERLATLFWGDSGEEEARRSLRNALSALRKALGEDALLADRETAQFNPAFNLAIDVIDFRTQAQRFLAAPTPSPALVDVTLYHGDLLDGFYDDWILRAREELCLLYLQVLMRLAQHWRTQGDYRQTIDIAHRILALDPAEEIAHQHLLFCYTLTGDRSAAQRQYEACVRALRNELDVDPAPETVPLYRRSQQTRSRKPSATAAHTNLPLPVSSFIGRNPEIAKLKTLLLGDGERSPVRLVTVTGPGGCGKTRLAIQVAQELLEVYADGVWWVELAALSDEGQVPQAVAKVLDVQQGVQPSLTDVIITNLRTKQALLVLDNCEHLVAACAELAEQLLSHCPDLQILATSREALGIFGETSWLVPSLTLPTVTLDSPAAYLQFEGIQLFVERASAVQRTFALTETNAPAVHQICQQLDGIPLALELAAARVKLMTAEQLAARLAGVIGERFNLLIDGSRTVLPRQQTLRATMAWSYALLTEQEQKLLQQLAIFAGGWTLEAAEATGADLVGAQPVALVLARLVDKSLVLVEPQGEAARYQMQETVRQYAHEQLEKIGETSAARDRHLVYFRQLAEQAEPEFRGRGQLTWLRRLDADYENLRAAMAWGLQYKSLEDMHLFQGATLAVALTSYWTLHSALVEGREWLEKTVEILDTYLKSTVELSLTQVVRLRAQALYGVGVLAWYQGKNDDAWRQLVASAETWRVVGDNNGLIYTQIIQADLLWQQRNKSAAYMLWDECLAWLCQKKDVWGEAWTLGFLAKAKRQSGNFTLARSYYEESNRLLQLLGDQWLFSLQVSHLGIMSAKQGEYTTAYAQFEQRLIIGQEFGLKYHIYVAVSRLAELASMQGNIDQAVTLAYKALTIARQLSRDPIDSLMYSNELDIIVRACIMSGKSERAAKLLATRYTFSCIPGHEDFKIERIHEELLTELRTRLDDYTFATAWAAGAAMTPEQAIAEALAED